MTTACLDCEFNSLGGELISLALYIDKDNYFYEVLETTEVITPWVKEHVIPFLNKEPIPKKIFQLRLEEFLLKNQPLTIVADWPDDIKYLCEVMITGPGTMIKTEQDLKFILSRVDAKSDLPHNALEDAKAIKRLLVSTPPR